jgi:predicted RNase H-like HicB family nuclease
MNKTQVEVIIKYTGNNFGAFVPQLPGCVATAHEPGAIISRIEEAIQAHVASSIADNDPLDDVFKGPFELRYQFDTAGMLAYFKGIFTNSAIEKLTGIHQKQIQHYASGLKKPRANQAKKIEHALHKLGKNLLDIEVIAS